MSLILEALNKADKERSTTNSNTPLQAEQPDIAAPKHSAINSLTILFALIAMIALGISFYLLKQTPAQSIPAQVKQTAPDLADQQSQPISLPAKKSSPVSSASNQQISALYQQQAIAKPTSAVQTNQPAQNSIASHAANDITKLPFLAELPKKLQKTIPSMDYNQHVYLAGPDSFIEMNDKILKASDPINNNLRLLRIEEHYSVLSINQKQFKLRALNSWVNFQ